MKIVQYKEINPKGSYVLYVGLLWGRAGEFRAALCDECSTAYTQCVDLNLRKKTARGMLTGYISQLKQKVNLTGVLFSNGTAGDVPYYPLEKYIRNYPEKTYLRDINV